MTKTRLRNLALPLGLAAAAAILIGIYVVSYRNSVTHGAGMVKVMVATRDIAAGTDGSTIAGGGYLKSQQVPRRAVVPGSVTSAAPLTSKVTSGQIYKGEQITLRQFAITAGKPSSLNVGVCASTPASRCGAVTPSTRILPSGMWRAASTAGPAMAST